MKLPTPLLLALAAGCSAEFEDEVVPLFDSAFRTVSVDSVTPAEFTDAGGFPVCLEGFGFQEDDIRSVTVQGEDCLSWSSPNDPSLLGCLVPPQPEQGDDPAPLEITVTKTDSSNASVPISYVTVDHEIVEVGCCGIRQFTEFQAGEGGAPTHVAPPVKIYVEGEAAYKVDLGVGTFNTDARDSCWTWYPAQSSGQEDGESLWTGEFNVPDDALSYSYIYRVSADDGRTWAYCDMLPEDGSCMENTGGGVNEYVPNEAGRFYVQ